MINTNSKLVIRETTFEFDHESYRGLLWVRAGLFIAHFYELKISEIDKHGYCDLLDGEKEKLFCKPHEAQLIKAYYDQQKAIFNENKALEGVA